MDLESFQCTQHLNKNNYKIDFSYIKDNDEIKIFKLKIIKVIKKYEKTKSINNIKEIKEINIDNIKELNTEITNYYEGILKREKQINIYGPVWIFSNLLLGSLGLYLVYKATMKEILCISFGILFISTILFIIIKKDIRSNNKNTKLLINLCNDLENNIKKDINIIL